MTGWLRRHWGWAALALAARPPGSDRCRNNAKGLLMGCNQVRQHKWQKVQLLIHPAGWPDLTRSVFYGTRKACAALVTFVSGLAGIGASWWHFGSCISTAASLEP